MIPFHRPYPLGLEERAHINHRMFKTLSSGMLSNDKYVRRLENNIKYIYNAKYCIATNSCTFGLMMCIKYLDPLSIQVPAFTWYSDLYLLKF
ncbi:unnamed protein product, partial [marine sediment metagenome]